MSLQIARRAFTVAEYYRMGEAGILTEDDRVELLEGEIVKMRPIGSHHAACVNRAKTLFNQRVGQRFIVSVQNPIRLDDFSEPQPDIALLRTREDFYARTHPTPGDVLLIIEIADTSVAFDREVKVPLYARASISEVWIVNLADDLIEVFSEPANGEYQSKRRLMRGMSLAVQAAPEISFTVDEIIG